jgi:hypothetical protein
MPNELTLQFADNPSPMNQRLAWSGDLFIYLIHATTPSIPKGYAAKEIQKKPAPDPRSVGYNKQ